MPTGVVLNLSMSCLRTNNNNNNNNNNKSSKSFEKSTSLLGG